MKPPSLLIAIPVFYVVLYVGVCVAYLVGPGEFNEIDRVLYFVGMLFWFGHTAFLYENLQRAIPLWQTIATIAALSIGLALVLWKLSGWYRIAATLLLLSVWIWHGVGILGSNL